MIFKKEKKSQTGKKNDGNEINIKRIETETHSIISGSLPHMSIKNKHNDD